MSAVTSQPSLADQLKNVVVSPRRDLSISRHVFRDGPAYIVRDSVTFKTHRFSAQDYQIVSAIDRSSSLGDTFDSLVAQGLLESHDEDSFYEFVIDLHQRNVLSLPLSDGAVLYRRYERRRKAEHTARLLGIFFLRVPLLNPDQLLNRTNWLFSWLFTTPACIGWAVLMLLGLALAIARTDELSAPMLTMFSGNNLLLLWAVLIGLKVIHEFGHAYACKAFGGHVPEMGALFVLFTPLAYVDATDSWSFPKTKQRAIVSLAGVYFESIVGVMALFVWAFTKPSTMNTIAYQTVMLATVTTVLFNMNPLLRYDAYYLVSDLAGVPNLRTRCEHAVATLAKRLCFGVREDDGAVSFTGKLGLVGFGLAQLGYRVVIMVTIATIVVMKFGSLGFALAAFVIGLPLFRACVSLAQYITSAPQLAGRRIRSAITAAGVVAAGVAGVLFVPLPWSVDATGVSTFEHVETLHAPSDGLIQWIPRRSGFIAKEGEPLVRLESAAMLAQRLAMEADVRHADSKAVRAASSSPGDALAEQQVRRAKAAALADIDDSLDHLAVRTPRDVRVLAIHQQTLGARVRKGDPLLTVGAGARMASILLPAQQMDRLKLRVGDTLAFRSSSDPEARFVGTVGHIALAADRTLDAYAGGLASELRIAVDPATGLAVQAYFEIRVTIEGEHAPPPNATIVARLPARWMTSASVVKRRIALFMNKVNRGFSER